MKRRLVLEYRIRKLEKAILEDIDSDLDKMSDDILKKDPYVDLDAELDKNAKDIIDKEPGYFITATNMAIILKRLIRLMSGLMIKYLKLS